MREQFLHEFEIDLPVGDLDVDLDPPPNATIRFDLNGTELWVAANRAGWLHLARVCAEIALQPNLAPGWHFHRAYDWSESKTPGQEVSFELLSAEPSDVRSVTS